MTVFERIRRGLCGLMCSVLGCGEYRGWVKFRFGLPSESSAVIPRRETRRSRYRFIPARRRGDVANTLTVTQKVPVSVEFKDAKGNPAKVDGTPAWLTDNPNILQLTPSADGLSCDVQAVGVIGKANVQVTADADLGSGVENIIGTAEIEVVGGKATLVNLTVGTPVEVPQV
jgi:hypothetical protein